MQETYIWEKKAWPRFMWDKTQINEALAYTKKLQFHLDGALTTLGFSVKLTNTIEAIASEIEKSSAIEGDVISQDDIRSSLAKRMGAENILTKHAMERLDTNQIPDRTHNIVRVVLDAIKNCNRPLTKTRLCRWHKLLFTGGFSNGFKITTGKYRRDEYGPMRIVSGSMKNERVHYIAPPAGALESEMDDFFAWFNAPQSIQTPDPIIKSAVTHLYFVSIHPFDDGNGRLARILSDMTLSRSGNDRIFSMSAQLIKRKSEYYAGLEKAQHGSLRITDWLLWYMERMNGAIESATDEIDKMNKRNFFWQRVRNAMTLNERQQKMLTLLTRDWKGKLTSTKWAAICKCSQDSATRDINALIKNGVLKQSESGGRSTSYELLL